MERNEREKKTQRVMYILLITLLLGYLGFKSWHISVALDSYDGQVLERDITGAAK